MNEKMVYGAGEKLMVDAIVIGVAIAFNTVIGFTQEFKAEKALRAVGTLGSVNSRIMLSKKLCEDLYIHSRLQYYRNIFRNGAG